MKTPVTISGSTLKIIATVTMLIDHVGLGLVYWAMVKYGWQYEVYQIFRTVGRLAFPIYCFLTVEGFTHTKNVRKYIGRMALFALISEIPYNLFLRYKIFSFEVQNVFFTLLLGLCAMYFLKTFEKKGFLKFAGVGVCLAAAYVLRCDYGYWGVAMIVLIYLLRESKPLQLCISAVGFLTQSIAASLAFIPIALYNGKQGLKLKYVFYVFFPAHILAICLLRKLMFNI